MTKQLAMLAPEPTLNVVFLGSGLVGLTSGACLARFGSMVTCVDIKERVVEGLCRGKLPLYEPKLEELVRERTKRGTLGFTTRPAPCIGAADVVFLTVGTASVSNSAKTDISPILSAARQLAPNLRGYTVVVVKSTVPIGTTRRIGKIIREGASPSAKFDMACNPEFLRASTSVEDFMDQKRIVLGVETNAAFGILRRLYQTMYAAVDNRIYLVPKFEDAEIIKYACNAKCAVDVSFANELAALCEKSGSDVNNVLGGMGEKGSIGGNTMHAGPGFGGSCIPKDSAELAHMSREYGASSRLIDAALAVNMSQPQHVTNILEEKLGDLRGRRIAVLGLAFKPGTDDMRAAPSLSIIDRFVERGAKVSAHDPMAIEAAAPLLPENVRCFKDPYKAVRNADATVIVTRWPEYIELDKKRMLKTMRGRLVFDVPSLLSPGDFEAAGLEYVSVGRG